MTDMLIALATSSTDLATAFNLQPDFTKYIVDYEPNTPTQLIDPYRHVKFFDGISGRPDYDQNLLTVPERITMIEKFLAHDYARSLKVMLEHPPATEQEITQVAQFIVSGMPMAQNMRLEVVML